MGFLDFIHQDTVHALRTLGQRPGFTATAVATLALAIGGNTTIFTVIRAVLLQPLGYPAPDRLVRIAGGTTPTRFTEMKAGAQSIAELGAYTGPEDIALSGAGEPEVVKAVRVSAGFLRILRIDPVRGRGFRPEEDAAGGAPVALISEELWQRHFAGDAQIIGRKTVLGTTPYTVIGVLPARFQFPFAGLDVWLTAPADNPAIPPRVRELSPLLTVFGRLKAGVTMAQANAKLQVIHRQYGAAHPAMLDAKPKTPVEIMEMKDELVSGVRSVLWLLFGAINFVLLIACANLAGLLLARSAARSREMAVRSALGAARGRLVGQLLAESVLLSLAGGMPGALLSVWGLHAISGLSSLSLPRAGEIRVDWGILAFAACLSIFTGILFGLAPSLRASKPDLMALLRASGAVANPGVPGGIFRGLNIRGGLLAGQIGLSTVLLIGATLLIETVAQLRRVDVGFNPAKLLTLRVALPAPRYDTDQKKQTFFYNLVERVGTAPGISGVAVAWYLPMMGAAGTPVQDANQPPLKLNERLIATLVPVTPGYFATLEIPMRSGRDFSEHDTAESQRVAIINESLARRFWPAYTAGQNPIGKKLLLGGVDPRPAEIIGIVADVHQGLESNPWAETVYTAFAQNPSGVGTLAIRTVGDPLRFAPAVREQVRALDRDQPISGVETMEDLMEVAVGPRRLLAPLLASFAGVALLLAVIGIYGGVAYSVGQRSREMGIRRALGAQHRDILRLVVGQALTLGLVGVAIGFAAAFALTRVMKALLFHISATDPAAFAGTGLLLIAVTLAASYFPAHRAAKVDPMAALRV